MADRLGRLRERIAQLTDRPVGIVAVTKGFEAALIERAAAAGCSAIGENYAQELVSKRDAVEAAAVEVQFIGQLQSNKVRQVAGLVSLWASVDRPSIADAIAARAPGATVLVQVDAIGAAAGGKGGCPSDEVPALVEHCRARGLNVDGTMTVGPTNPDPEATTRAFTVTRALADDLDLPRCSMGMSGDWERAVELGATEVRIGTTLFGERSSPHRPTA